MADIEQSTKKFLTAWNNLSTTRASEESIFNTAIGTANAFTAITQLVQTWIQVATRYNQLSKRKKASLNSEIALIERFLNQGIQCANTHNNGLQWVVNQTTLLSTINSLESCFVGLERTIQKDRLTQAIDLKAGLLDDLSLLEQGIDLAKDISEKSRLFETNAAEIEAQLKSIRQLQEKSATETEQATKRAAGLAQTLDSEAQEASSRISEAAKAASELSEEKCTSLEDIEKQLTESLSNAKKQSSEVATLLSKTQKISSEITAHRELAEGDLSKAKAKLAEAIEKNEQSRQSLNSALKNVRRQGLSGAFFEKATEIQEQRRKEEKSFQLALLYLAVVGCIGLVSEYWLGSPSDFFQWILRTLRTLILAVPGVWIAWLSARRLSALNRMVSDYEYKSAAALAFESYRQEIESSGNKALMSELLRHAVDTFGENPTRYYDLARDEAAMPAEGFIDRLRRPQTMNGNGQSGVQPPPKDGSSQPV